MTRLFLLTLIALCAAEDLILNGVTRSMGGNYTFGTVRLTNSIINVVKYNGNFATSGILEIHADSFYMDATSVINARGTGWQTPLCSDGLPLRNSGGAGGCSVRDSGGGGGHIGAGGVGTTDCQLPPSNPHCQFPKEFEQTCNGNPLPNRQCDNYSNCRTGSGVPSTAGIPLPHSVFDDELGMGGSGGDKGCRDGDGFNIVVGGNGGGRVKLFSTGSMNILGRITTAGFRGCGIDNDSGGGGAGGTILLVADELNVDNSTTDLDASGGRGGDSQNKTADQTECARTQFGGTCDDCGGGGGGGLIYIKANSGTFRVNTGAYNVSGAFGGSCIGCENEAKGVDGWVQFGSEGEECNGYDDTYDGLVDENQPLLSCGIPSCVDGVIQSCPDGPTNNPTPSTSRATGRSTGRSTTGSTQATTSSTASTSANGVSSSDSTNAPATVTATATATELNSLSQSQTVIITTEKNNPSVARSSSASASASNTPTETVIGESSAFILVPFTVLIVLGLATL